MPQDSKASKAPKPTTAAMQTNYISSVVGTLKQTVYPLVNAFGSLSPGLKLGVSFVVGVVLFIPAIWFVIMLPFMAVSLIAVYSALFGYDTFVKHFESAMREHLELSDAKIKLFHEKAGELKGHATGAKKLVGDNATNYFFIGVYGIISLTMLAIECVIKKLQSLLGLLKDQSAKAQANLPQEKKKI